MRYLRQLERSHSHSPNVGMNDYFDGVFSISCSGQRNKPKLYYTECKVCCMSHRGAADWSFGAPSKVQSEVPSSTKVLIS